MVAEFAAVGFILVYACFMVFTPELHGRAIDLDWKACSLLLIANLFFLAANQSARLISETTEVNSVLVLLFVPQTLITTLLAIAVIGGAFKAAIDLWVKFAS